MFLIIPHNLEAINIITKNTVIINNHINYLMVTKINIFKLNNGKYIKYNLNDKYFMSNLNLKFIIFFHKNYKLLILLSI